MHTIGTGGEGKTRFHSACSLRRGSEFLSFGILTGHKIRHELKWYKKAVAEIAVPRLQSTPPPPKEVLAYLSGIRKGYNLLFYIFEKVKVELPGQIPHFLPPCRKTEWYSGNSI